MALIICNIIAYIQILSAGDNLWSLDPKLLANAPMGRNTFFLGLFLLVQVLGLASAILILHKRRLGFILSIFHHLLLLPALVITKWGMVVLLDDHINMTFLVMSKPTGLEFGFYWSLGWGSVFDQVARAVPIGSNYFGVNLFAYACACAMWVGMDRVGSARAERGTQPRRGQRQAKRPQLALPPPERAAQRADTQKGARQPQRIYQQNGGRQPRASQW